MTPTFTTSKPDRWVQPRAHTDASQRYATYGKLVPLDPPYNARRDFLALAVLLPLLAVGVVLACVVVGF